MTKLIAAISLSFFALMADATGQGLTTKSAQLTTPPVHFAPQWPDLLFSEHLSFGKPQATATRVFLPAPTDHLAFFCRLELKIEKTTKFPVKFRLGDVEYVDRLEGKRE